MPKKHSRALNADSVGLPPLADATFDLPPLSDLDLLPLADADWRSFTLTSRAAELDLQPLNDLDLQPLGDLDLPRLRDGDLGSLPFDKRKTE